MSGDIRKKLLLSFKEELREHIAVMRERLFRSGGASRADWEEAFRRAHSLKGAARAVDLKSVETVGHLLETMLSRVRHGTLEAGGSVLGAARQLLDAIEDWAEAFYENKKPEEPREVLRSVRTLLGVEEYPEDEGPADVPEVGGGTTGEGTLRVRADAIERLSEAADRMSVRVGAQADVSRSLERLESVSRSMEANRDALRRTHRLAIERLRNSRELAPIADYLGAVERCESMLLREVRSVRRLHAAAVWDLVEAGRRLQEGVREARMVEAGSVFPALGRMVRDLAKAQQVSVEFASFGLDLRADRLVLQELKDPLMHVLRNAISHGAQAPESREAAGRPRAMRVRVDLSVRGGQLHLSVSDDGKGVDWAGVAQRAVRKGLLSREEAQGAGRKVLSRLLFHPGFSTARMITDLSGRGMGLSVVAEAVKRLGGTVGVRDGESGGAVVEAVVPVTITTTQLVFFDLDGGTYAFPLSSVLRFERRSVKYVETIEGRPVVRFPDGSVPVVGLSAVLQGRPGSLKHDGGFLNLALLRSGDRSVAVALDGFRDVSDGIVKPLRGGAQRLGLYCGAVSTGGSPVAVIDPEEVMRRFESVRGGTLEAAQAAPRSAAATVLVVDDSLTTRTLEKSILEAHGYDVALAVDGEDGLRKMRSVRPDVVVVDVQMPRMTGLEMIERMKADERLSNIPVVIVSSLESREDKARGMSLGADAYIVKRKFDHRGLLDTIRQII